MFQWAIKRFIQWNTRRCRHAKVKYGMPKRDNGRRLLAWCPDCGAVRPFTANETPDLEPWMLPACGEWWHPGSPWNVKDLADFLKPSEDYDRLAEQLSKTCHTADMIERSARADS